MSLRDAMAAQLLQQVAEARALGHDVDQELVAGAYSNGKPQYRGRCSCGWQSRPKPSVHKALLATMTHVGVVTGNGEPHPVTDPVPDDLPRRVAH